MKVGDIVQVLPGTMESLRTLGFVANYMIESVDGKSGPIVDDHRDIIGCPHVSVDLGFEFPVGIPTPCLKVVKSHKSSSDCNCPTVMITARPGQVSEHAQRKVADILNAMVELRHDEAALGVRTVFGRHCDDCPCRK